MTQANPRRANRLCLELQAVLADLPPAYCKLANDIRFTAAERALLARIADTWAALLECRNTVYLDVFQGKLYNLKMCKLIAYYRVPTDKRGESGLGLEVQRATVHAFAKSVGASIRATFTDEKFDKRSDPPGLAKAIAKARRIKAPLCIAELGRLARDVRFLSAIMEAGVEFIACDNPMANRLTIQILATVAEDEVRRISERTKSALVAAKARGALLGSARPGHWRGNEAARLKGARKGNEVSATVRRKKAMDAVADLLPLMKERRAAGASLSTIAGELNAGGQRTTRGNQWTAGGVKLVLDRAAQD